MNKKYMIGSVIIIIVLLILFFYPKTNNVWDDTFSASAEKQYKNKDCTCIGFSKMKSGLSRSDTLIRLCYGLPTNCEYTCKKEINGQWQDISCDELDHLTR